jgi:Xaa-Pro aminopeptidase
MAITSGKLLGRTENDVAREVRERLTGAGHEVSSFAIVGSGPNSASPHHEASSRVINAGDAIVLDIGGVFGGYGSDTTRTIWVTGPNEAVPPSDDFLRRYEILKRSHQAAMDHVRPGVSCESVDAAARAVIDAAGEGARFFHRTGHGIGSTKIRISSRGTPQSWFQGTPSPLSLAFTLRASTAPASKTSCSVATAQ